MLPAVDKYICSFQRWLPGPLAYIAGPEHLKTIKLFATWHARPRLRERADRRHITPSIRRFAAEQIKYATTFLRWLSARHATLSSCGQLDIDAWFAENAEHVRTCLRALLNWARRSRRCRRSLSVPTMKIFKRPALSEGERLAALGRLLSGTDTPTGSSLHPTVKIKGAAGGDRLEQGLEPGGRVLVGPGPPPAVQGGGRGKPGADCA
ncbi:hypothetical protein AB0B79_32265 [Streptomyces sp. NPDC039022]|uniref:hypothetical protein n=1 Tax=Streptomyces sp. NPDC039022 TaxID=3157091 RepID=UPI0033E3386B